MNRKYYLDEEWRPIQEYEGLYDVSNYGRVRSYDYYKKGNTQILQTQAIKGYYIKVGLSKNGQKRYFRVHRLVAIAFLPPPQEGQTQVEHLNCDKQDNRVENLRWTSPKGNMANPLTRLNLSIGHMCPSEETRARMSAGQKKRFAYERATKTGRYAPSRM